MMIYRFKYLIFVFVLFIKTDVEAQSLVALSSKYNDDFNNWYIYTDSTKLVGELNTRWPQKQDFAEWDYRIGEVTGMIRQKWPGEPFQWDVRGDNEIITIQSVYPRDYSEWRITYKDKSYQIKPTYGNQWDEWQLVGKNGSYHVFTTKELDPRDWDIEDGLPDENIHVRMALAFIVVYCGIVSN
jgi:hypothetical protein